VYVYIYIYIYIYIYRRRRRRRKWTRMAKGKTQLRRERNGKETEKNGEKEIGVRGKR